MPFPSEHERDRLRSLSVLLVLLAITALAVVVWREFEVRRDVYASILENKAETTVREFDAFFGPIQTQLQVIRAWGEDASLEIGDPDGLDARFLPLLRSQTWPSQLSIATEDGFQYRLVGEDGDWVRVSDPGGLRRSEWYRLAVSDLSGAAHSTPATEAGGTTVHFSAAWLQPDRGHVGVIELGIARDAIDSLVEAFPVTENGMMALLGSDQTIAWYIPSRGEGFNRTNAHQLLHPDEEAEALLAEALYVWTREGAPMQQAIHFRHAGDAWWAWRGPFQTGAGSRDLLLLLPGRDLSARLMTVTSPLTYGLLFLFGLCVFLLVRMAVGYRGRLDRMTGAATHSDSSEEELRGLIAKGESDHLEFKSTLRWNLRENRPGREIEIAWLKTVVAFLNTEGGTLLVGVGDNGKIVGIEKDGFRNEDKYLLHVNNLIQRHIGVKYARYLRYNLLPIGGRQVLVVDVLPSDEPCFLMDSDDDQFYVRIGPATRKLSVRKTMEYLEKGLKS